LIIKDEKNTYAEEFTYVKGSKQVKRKDYLKEKKKGDQDKPEKAKLNEHINSNHNLTKTIGFST
jgi:hypothetical protein